jgi:hypothetical protein
MLSGGLTLSPDPIFLRIHFDQSYLNQSRLGVYTIKSPERVSVTLLREPSSGHVSYFELGKAY